MSPGDVARGLVCPRAMERSFCLAQMVSWEFSSFKKCFPSPCNPTNFYETHQSGGMLPPLKARNRAIRRSTYGKLVLMSYENIVSLEAEAAKQPLQILLESEQAAIDSLRAEYYKPGTHAADRYKPFRGKGEHVHYGNEGFILCWGISPPFVGLYREVS